MAQTHCALVLASRHHPTSTRRDSVTLRAERERATESWAANGPREVAKQRQLTTTNEHCFPRSEGIKAGHGSALRALPRLGSRVRIPSSAPRVNVEGGGQRSRGTADSRSRRSRCRARPRELRTAHDVCAARVPPHPDERRCAPYWAVRSCRGVFTANPVVRSTVDAESPHV